MVKNWFNVFSVPKRYSTVRGREFGDGLRAAIADAGMTSRAVAELLDWEESKLSDLVNGKGGSNELELALVLGVCRTPHEVRDHLFSIYRAIHVKGWLREHGAAEPTSQRTLAQHERMAKTILDWQPILVPGTLQTPGYARAVLAACANPLASDVDEWVAARVARHKVLRPGLTATFYIHEWVLKTPVGGEEVMREQLQHLSRVSMRPYVTIRVIPTLAGANAGQAGGFTLLRFHKHEPVVFVDSENTSLYIEAPNLIKTYDAVIESLAGVALNEEESRNLIDDIAG